MKNKYVRQVSPGEAVSLGLNQIQPVLAHLDIELTERCNLNCIHCYINRPAADPDCLAREMSTEQVRDILDQAAALGCLSVRFTGGEPLLRSDFNELYSYARRLGMRVMLFTNATLLHAGHAELFARIPPLERIEITVYGMSETSYRTVTGKKNSWKAVKKGINLLINHNIPFIVKSVLLPDNCHERDAFEEWAATLPWMNKAPRYTHLLTLRARRDLPGKQEQIAEMRCSSATELQFLLHNEEEYRETASQFCRSSFMGIPGSRLFRCGAGRGGCVDAYGMLQPCMLLRHPDTVWNLREHSLSRILTDFFPELRKKKAVNREYLERCARCRLKGFCEQCPGHSWMEHGTLDTPVEYLCRLAHGRAYELGILHSDEQGWQKKI